MEEQGVKREGQREEGWREASEVGGKWRGMRRWVGASVWRIGRVGRAERGEGGSNVMVEWIKKRIISMFRTVAYDFMSVYVKTVYITFRTLSPFVIF